jgi:hypothetical protein
MTLLNWWHLGDGLVANASTPTKGYHGVKSHEEELSAEDLVEHEEMKTLSEEDEEGAHALVHLLTVRNLQKALQRVDDSIAFLQNHDRNRGCVSLIKRNAYNAVAA